MEELTIISYKIYTLRSVQIMLDRDLADFYEVKAIRLREQVKRNLNRFPDDFMFQLSDSEVDYMVSQNAIPSRKHLGGTLPYAFTEQGVAALSSVLTSDRAVEISIALMRAFVMMRRIIADNTLLYQRLNTLEHNQKVTDSKLETVLNALEHSELTPKQGIFYDGEIFEAYVFVTGLIKKANRSIYLVDNYVDESVLTMLSKNTNNVLIKIFTRDISKQLLLDIRKFESQFGKIEVIQFNDSHDRFLILDDEDIYHFGASLKDIGKKWFAFSKMDSGIVKILDKLRERK